MTDLDDLLAKRDLAGLIDAIATNLTICGCAENEPCSRDHTTTTERSTT